MTSPDGGVRYAGFSSVSGPQDEPALPTSGAGQSCAFCRSATVAWLHPLDPDQVAFRMHGKGYTLPWFWTTCAECESHVSSGDDEALVRARAESGRSVNEDDDDMRLMVGVFRRADQGPRPLTR